MSELPALPGGYVIRALEKAGFVVARRASSHVMMKRPGHRFVLTIVVHGSKCMSRGTLRKVIRHSGLTVDEFCDLLD